MDLLNRAASTSGRGGVAEAKSSVSVAVIGCGAARMMAVKTYRVVWCSPRTCERRVGGMMRV